MATVVRCSCPIKISVLLSLCVVALAGDQAQGFRRDATQVVCKRCGDVYISKRSRSSANFKQCLTIYIAFEGLRMLSMLRWLDTSRT